MQSRSRACRHRHCMGCARAKARPGGPPGSSSGGRRCAPASLRCSVAWPRGATRSAPFRRCAQTCRREMDERGALRARGHVPWPCRPRRARGRPFARHKTVRRDCLCPGSPSRRLQFARQATRARLCRTIQPFAEVHCASDAAGGTRLRLMVPRPALRAGSPAMLAERGRQWDSTHESFWRTAPRPAALLGAAQIAATACRPPRPKLVPFQ